MIWRKELNKLPHVYKYVSGMHDWLRARRNAFGNIYFRFFLFVSLDRANKNLRHFWALYFWRALIILLGHSFLKYYFL